MASTSSSPKTEHVQYPTPPLDLNINFISSSHAQFHLYFIPALLKH